MTRAGSALPIPYLEAAGPLPEPVDGSAAPPLTAMVGMRDGVRLATDVYLPDLTPAPVVVLRTPYGRRVEEKVLREFARRGYVAVAQDVRGTGDSEPDQWRFMIFEPEDGYDCVEWITHQEWYGGFIGSFGGSYCGSTQAGVATHPAASAIVPEVAGLGVTVHRNPPHHLFINAYVRTIGKGEEVGRAERGDQLAQLVVAEREMHPETLATGYFDRPLHEPVAPALLERYPELAGLSPVQTQDRLWELFAGAPPAERAELAEAALGHSSFSYYSAIQLGAVFGRAGNRSAFSLPRPDVPSAIAALRARILFVGGWYDWNIVETIASYQAVVRHAPPELARDCRIVISPSAHNTAGYVEDADAHPELLTPFRTQNIVDVLDGWYRAVADDAVDDWAPVSYYLMGANEWRTATTWPPAETRPATLYLREGGGLSEEPPGASEPDSYVYDPHDPPPTLGGNILSRVLAAGSVDVSSAQARADVLVFTTEALERNLDVVGPIRVTLFASTSATETDFTVRLSDVRPDGRAIQIANTTLQTRHRSPDGAPELVTPGQVVEYAIEVGSTAHRFAAGHRLRVDIASADFPKYERNANRGGVPGDPIPARQTVHHDPEHPSRLDLRIAPPA